MEKMIVKAKDFPIENGAVIKFRTEDGKKKPEPKIVVGEREISLPTTIQEAESLFRARAVLIKKGKHKGEIQSIVTIVQDFLINAEKTLLKAEYMESGGIKTSREQSKEIMDIMKSAKITPEQMKKLVLAFKAQQEAQEEEENE